LFFTNDVKELLIGNTFPTYSTFNLSRSKMVCAEYIADPNILGDFQ